MRSSRPACWAAPAVLGVCLGIGTACSDARPSIVLFVVDTLRSDHLGSYGHPSDTAPQIRKLAESGVLFERTIAASSWTKTSMASLMTSRKPDRHGVRRPVDVLPGELATLAGALAHAGYHTLGVNSNAWLKAAFGFDAGFDVYGTKHFANAEEVNEAALRALEGVPAGPFFLYVHYMDVHAPYLPAGFEAEPVRIDDLGPLSDAELEERYRKQGLDGAGVRERVMALYDGEIRVADAAIGSLLAELERHERLDNTIVAVTSDHGEAFGEHGTTEHGWNLYPEVIQVPWVVSWEGHLEPGARIPEQVRSIDVAPTLLALAGVPVPGSFEGEPLLPLGAAPREDRIAVCAVGGNDYLPDRDYVAVVSSDHLYVRERASDTVEFYDLRRDPGATTDLGRRHPDVDRYAVLEGPAASPAAEQIPLDEQTRRELRTLGYLVDE